MNSRRQYFVDRRSELATFTRKVGSSEGPPEGPPEGPSEGPPGGGGINCVILGWDYYTKILRQYRHPTIRLAKDRYKSSILL